MTSDSCICRRTLYYQQHTPDPKCEDCPTGANCSAKDGLVLSQVIPLPGYYLSTLEIESVSAFFFLDCKIGYKSDELAKEICVGGERNQSKMCKQGYSGPLCVSHSRNDPQQVIAASLFTKLLCFSLSLLHR